MRPSDFSSSLAAPQATESAQALLLDYAAGNLDEALHLIVESHLSFSKDSYRKVREFETIAGSLLCHDIAPVSVSDKCLHACLESLDIKREVQASHKLCAQEMGLCETLRGLNLPQALLQVLTPSMRWSHFMSGMEMINIPMSQKSRVHLLRVAPGIETPDHTHKGIEVTLVLDGAFDDIHGRHEVGNLIVEDGTTTHAPVADKRQGCICLTVTTAPIHLTGFWGVLINPFLK
jgi:putative transcriptional regulator